MGLLKLLGLSTAHEGQHTAGKHTKQGKAKPPRATKGGKKAK